MKFTALLAASAAVLMAAPAMAQETGGRDKSQDFNGAYVTIGGGGTLQGSDRGETLVFDTDRDGAYGDTVTTVAGANAFSPGFCNGAATSTANGACMAASGSARRWWAKRRWHSPARKGPARARQRGRG